ncbi:MAG: hypothetical protein BGP16_15430 [Sphingobium sp. 66-54]|nr:MAG: hypothetical protein BGP16_15430 [Sphingobium sp. 66-54]
MKQRIAAACAAALLLGLVVAPAQAEGLGAEGNYVRANGNWGAELGAGYSLGFAGFSLTPGAGLYFRDGDTALYGRIEATYQVPASLRIGLGLRLSGDDPRPYATVAMPLLPKVAIKGNVGPKYVGAGLTIGY